MRRVLGALVAVAALVGAAASQRKVEGRRLLEAQAAAEQAAGDARQGASEALRHYLTTLESRALAAAALPALRAQLLKVRDDEGLEGALGRTLEDWLNTEADWEPFRREFKVYGLSVEGEKLGLLFGAPTDPPFAAGPLVVEARAKGLSTGVIAGGQTGFAVVATRITVPGRKTYPVVLLAKPLDEGALEAVSERVRAAALLAAGKSVVARHGSKAQVDRLVEAVGDDQGEGRETPQVYVAEDGSWAAAGTRLGQGLWLWTHVDATTTAREAARSGTVTKATIWSAGALIAIVALIIGLRHGAATTVLAPAPAAVPTRSTAPGPAMAPAGATAPGHAAAPMGTAPGLVPSSPAPTPSEDSIAFGSTLMLGTPQAALPQFGRYALLDKLGEGGMAQVFTAVVFGAEGFRRRFVVKRLRPELVNEQPVVAQFIDEANMAASLVHSNIIPVLDFGKVGDEYFLATEYILGRDLGRVTKGSLEKLARPLPVSALLYAAHETLRALEYAHTRTGEGGRPLGIVHRDVSPSNILVSARGEVKLFDFGIVKAEGRVTRTQHGVVKGNVNFMSPEQARGVEVDARADLFSLGLVMYYCLAGDVLYQGNTSYELLLKAATGPGPEELARLHALPAPAAALIARALAVDPAARFQSAAEFAAAVAPHIGRGAAELAELMTSLFADELRAEDQRFSSAVPAVAPGAPGTTTRTGTSELRPKVTGK